MSLMREVVLVFDLFVGSDISAKVKIMAKVCFDNIDPSLSKWFISMLCKSCNAK